jgi:hypothetical protein
LTIKEEDEASVVKRIRKSMNNWEAMDATGRLAGRGLGRRELIGRVANEVGTSRAAVESALKDL